MKVVAFNGSPRKNGNTNELLSVLRSRIEAAGIEFEQIDICKSHPRGCTACYACKEKQNLKCVITSDPMNEWIAKMIEADGIILASPVYFSNLTSEMKALIDRAGVVGKTNGNAYKRKVGAAVVAVRRAGGIPTFDALNHFFQINQMMVVGSSYWNLGVGRDPGDVKGDEEGIQTMTDLGDNMAWLLKQVNKD